MENNIQKFAEEYKALENAVRRQGFKTVLDYENTLEQEDADRLRVCRQMRNYLQHHEDGMTFLSANLTMCAFLRRLANDCGKEKSRILNVPAIRLDDRITDVEKIFQKTRRAWLPVTDRQGLYKGSLPMSRFIFLLSRNAPRTPLSVAASEEDLQSSDVITVLESQADDVYGQDAVVLNPDGTYIGVIDYAR